MTQHRTGTREEWLEPRLRLLDAEKENKLVTRVFRASRNSERDEPAEAWAAEFERKARTIIDARCN